MREAVSKSAVSAADIVSIGVDTTCCSVVALDANVRERGWGAAQAEMWGASRHGEEGGRERGGYMLSRGTILAQVPVGGLRFFNLCRAKRPF